MIKLMRSPLGPVLANLFMGFYEKQWLKEFNASLEFCYIDVKLMI